MTTALNGFSSTITNQQIQLDPIRLEDNLTKNVAYLQESGIILLRDPTVLLHMPF